MTLAPELTDEQREAVSRFGSACVVFMQAMGGLEAAGVDISTALRAMPGSEEGRSMYDELPGSIKMML